MYKELGIGLVIIGLILILLAALFHFNVLKINNNQETFDNLLTWNHLGKAAWFPVFGNSYVYNNDLEYRREGNHWRYRIKTYDGAIHDVIQIDKLRNGSVIQIADPTNPHSIELAVQINDGRYWTSN